jgi:lysophospholipase L1-like esterase
VTTLPPHFLPAINSRFPHLSDYDPVAHQFHPAYLNPISYTITIEDFPGAHLSTKGNSPDDEQRPGSHPVSSPDIYTLDCPADTTGWRFWVVGRSDQPGPGGTLATVSVNKNAENSLTTFTRPFPEILRVGAWRHEFTVPGPGTYQVTTERLRGTATAETKSQTLVIKDYLVVSIGDSAASGEGNPDAPGKPADFGDHSWWQYVVPGYNLYVLTEEAVHWVNNTIATHETQLARRGNMTINMDPNPVWFDPQSHRSLWSGHAVAARLLEDLTSGTVVTFLPFAHSGADIASGLIGPGPDSGLPVDSLGQLDQVRATVGSRRIDALLVYIGINDIGVADTLTNLVVGDAPILGQDDPTAAREQAQAVADARLRDLPGKLERLAAALSPVNVAKVYITEYPTGLFDDIHGNPAHGCELFNGPKLDLSREDAVLVQSLASNLNQILKTAAHDHGWVYVTGIDQQLRGCGYCTPVDRRAFVQCGESLLLQGDTEGTIHPNARGHAIIGQAVAASVRENSFLAIPPIHPDPVAPPGQFRDAAT